MCLYSHLFCISSVVVIVWQYRDVSVFSSVLYFYGCGYCLAVHICVYILICFIFLGLWLLFGSTYMCLHSHYIFVYRSDHNLHTTIRGGMLRQ